MLRRKFIPVVLVALLAMSWVVPASHAGEPVGPSTPGATSACSALAAVFGTPAPALPSGPLAAAIGSLTCGSCSEPGCRGLKVGAGCGASSQTCVVSGSCATSVPRCFCAFPP